MPGAEHRMKIHQVQSTAISKSVSITDQIFRCAAPYKHFVRFISYNGYGALHLVYIANNMIYTHLNLKP